MFLLLNRRHFRTMRFLQLKIFHKSECNDHNRQIVIASRFHRVLLSLLHRVIDDEIIEKIIQAFG
jgi:hypothetical protein